MPRVEAVFKRGPYNLHINWLRHCSNPLASCFLGLHFVIYQPDGIITPEAVGLLNNTSSGMAIVKLPYDVNDPELRDMFFRHMLPDYIEALEEHTAPEWGRVSSQHMLEHLIYSFLPQKFLKPVLQIVPHIYLGSYQYK